jgi:hypothetical protein
MARSGKKKKKESLRWRLSYVCTALVFDCLVGYGMGYK